MVRIRLSRVGRKNAPAYRIVAVDRKAKRDGKSLEVIGHFNPTENPDKFEYKKDRYEYWVSVGAQPSSAVKKLLSGNYKYVPYNPNAKSEEVEAETPKNATDESKATEEQTSTPENS